MQMPESPQRRAEPKRESTLIVLQSPHQGGAHVVVLEAEHLEVKLYIREPHFWFGRLCELQEVVRMTAAHGSRFFPVLELFQPELPDRLQCLESIVNGRFRSPANEARVKERGEILQRVPTRCADALGSREGEASRE